MIQHLNVALVAASIGLILLGYTLGKHLIMSMIAPGRCDLPEVYYFRLFAAGVLVVALFVPVHGWYRWWYLLVPLSTCLIGRGVAVISEYVNLYNRWQRRNRRLRRRLEKATAGGNERFAMACLRRDKDVWVRWEAVRALGKMGKSHSVLPLIELLESEDDIEIRTEAALALGSIGAPEAVSPLLRVFASGNSKLIGAASKALVMLGHPRSAL